MNSPIPTAIICLPLLTSCYYRTHVRMAPETDPNPPVLTMKVGETRKIASKTVLTHISMGFMFGPGNYMKSTDSKVVSIDSESALEWTASAEAQAPGTAEIHFQDRYTRVVVVPSTTGKAP